jgi:SAM-dependent methyltransferase
VGDLTSDEWDRRYVATDLLWGAAPNQFLVAEVGNLRPGRALDVASGEGRNAVWLARSGWSVTAVDFSEVAIAKGRSMASDYEVEVDWVLADVREYRPAAGAFDLVAILYLHLVPAERQLVLAAATEAVAPGGTLLIVGHDLENLTRGHGGPQDAERLWTADVAVAELDGMEIVRAGQVIRKVAVDGGEVEAIDTLVRARRP